MRSVGTVYQPVQLATSRCYGPNEPSGTVPWYREKEASLLRNYDRWPTDLPISGPKTIKKVAPQLGSRES